MYCIKCGNEINKKDKYCNKCGAEAIKDNSEFKLDLDGMRFAGIGCGIVSIPISLVVPPIGLIFAIIGIVLGIIDLNKTKKKMVLVISIIACTISVLLFCLYTILVARVVDKGIDVVTQIVEENIEDIKNVKDNIEITE